jgi:hypothetical protein
MSYTTDKRYYSLFPKTLESLIEPLTRPVFKEKGLAGARIITEWPNIVGRSLAAHCIPEKLSFPRGKKTGGTLTIAVENGFATELQHMQPQILERLSGYFGYQSVSRITISHSYLKAQSITKKSTAKTPCAIDTSALESLDDPELKLALQSFAQGLKTND